MTKGRVGILLTLTLLLALGTLFQDFRFDQALTADQSVAVKVDREVGALEVQLSDLRAAQSGYLAAGVVSRRDGYFIIHHRAVLEADSSGLR